MIVASYATNDDHYRPFRERLIASCERVGLRHQIELVEPWGVGSGLEPYYQQCCHKPKYISQCLNDEPVLWVDVDSVFTRLPVLGEGGDVGFINNPFGNRMPISGGVIAFWPTEAAHRFLREWQHLCDIRKQGEETDHMRMVWASESVDADYIDITENMKGTLELWTSRGKKGKAL